MNKKFKLFTVIITVIALSSLSACTKKGLVIKNGPAGPDTGDLIDPLPEGLIADKANARHGENDLKPDIN